MFASAEARKLCIMERERGEKKEKKYRKRFPIPIWWVFSVVVESVKKGREIHHSAKYYVHTIARERVRGGQKDCETRARSEDE